MKKFTLLSAVLVAGMATAQVQSPMNMEIRKAEIKSVEMTAEVTMEEWNAEYVANQKKAAAADYAAHDYYFVEGMMHFGYTPQFYGLMSSFIAIPYMDSVVWTNYYGPTDWYMQHNNELAAEDSETYVTGYGIDGTYYLPYTTDHTLNISGTDYQIKGYKYAAGNENGGYVASATSPVIISTGEMIPVTLCGMETDPMNNESGSDFYQIGAGKRGTYAYGTELYTSEDKTVRADTILSTVRNVSPLKINAINIPVYNDGSKAVIPEGAEIKIEVFAADLLKGVIYTDSLLGEVVATADNYLEVGATMGTISAAFQKEDILGGMQDAPIVAEGDFVVQITGYNEGGCNFGIFADYYTPGGTTVYKVGGKYTPIFSASSNLAITYDAYWPVAVVATANDVLEAPVEGGVAKDGEYSAFAIYTNVADIESWDIAADEWLTMAVDTSTYSAEGYFVAQVTAEALTEGEGRKGVVTIDADGYKAEIVVVQGKVEEDDTAIEDVKAPIINDNKLYNLLGVEVDETYKGIVIKNGVKFIQ
jgi:hypothetical protein